MGDKRNLLQTFIGHFITICIISAIAAISAIPVALAIKFIVWLF